MDTLEFKVQRIRFAKDMFHIVTTERGEAVSGNFSAVVGKSYVAEGYWDRTSPAALKFGATFKATRFMAAPEPKAGTPKSELVSAPTEAKAKDVGDEEESLSFQIAQIRFESKGFYIVTTTSGDSVTGKFYAREGHMYKGYGRWDHTSEKAMRYGPSFQLTSAVAIQLKKPEDICRFLAMQFKGKGIGEVFFHSLADACKAESLDLEEMLDKAKRDELVDCVGKRNAKKVDALLAAWPTLKPGADLISPLLGYGLSEAQAENLVIIFGKNAVKKVEDEPYDLILRLDGVGFPTADKIAMKVGVIAKTDPVRLRAALSAAMQDATRNGDIGVERTRLLEVSLPLVNESFLENGKRKLVPNVPLIVSEELLEATLDEMIGGKCLDALGKECSFASNLIEFVDEKGKQAVWYAPLVAAERNIAARLSAIDVGPLTDALTELPKYIAESGLTLSEEQMLAVTTALTEPVTVVTGGPGRGKSALLKVLLTALVRHVKAKGKEVYQCAPTGKASKRITQATGYPASTIHSLIGFQPGGNCSFNQAMPLPAGALIIDEASMADTELMSSLLQAVPNDCRIIIVGDRDQLASVGPGQVLRDLIRSQVLPVVRLTKIFRQGAGSGIPVAAELINNGELPKSTEDGAFTFVSTEDPNNAVKEQIHKLLEEGVDPNDIQILSPVRERGQASCLVLNKLMQDMVNPLSEHAARFLKRDSGNIGIGDRVIQNKNNKDIGLVNGDIGWVDDISADGVVTLTLPDKAEKVILQKKDAQDLSLAYAITVHRSQGAEAPYVIIAMDSNAQFMLRRNLIYTGVTRASKKCWVFAPMKVMFSGVRKGEPEEGSRRTSLVSKLVAQFGIVNPEKVANVVSRMTPMEKAASAMNLEMEDILF